MLLIARAAKEAFDPEGVTVWSSNGAAAGQEVGHFHLHVMPRWHDDGLLRVYPRAPANPTREDLDQQAGALRRAIGTPS